MHLPNSHERDVLMQVPQLAGGYPPLIPTAPHWHPPNAVFKRTTPHRSPRLPTPTPVNSSPGGKGENLPHPQATSPYPFLRRIYAELILFALY